MCQLDPYQFVDADGDFLHIGIPVTPANGAAAISFYTPSDPVHVPVDRIEELITVLRRLVAAQPPTTADAAQQPQPLDLDAIQAAINGYRLHPTIGFNCCSAHPVADAGAAMADEIRRLRAELATARVTILREVADECDEAGGKYTARALNDHAAGAFTLMETFLRKANEAEYVATPCDPMVPCEDGGEPCHTHERLMAHAEGDHELCEPGCPLAAAEETHVVADDSDQLCTSEFPGDDTFVGQLCQRERGHNGEHRATAEITGTRHRRQLTWTTPAVLPSSGA